MHIISDFDHSLPLHSSYSFRSRAIRREQRSLGWQTSQLTSLKHYPPDGDDEDIHGPHFYRTSQSAALIARLPLIKKVAVDRSIAVRLRELCGKLRPDLIHAHSPCLVGLAALRVGRAVGQPVVYEMRASYDDAAAHHGTTREVRLQYRASRRLETYVLRRAGAVTRICQRLREDILSRGVDEHAVTGIPNAVDVEGFVDRPPNARLAERFCLMGGRVLGFAGSFYAYKGLELLVRAMPRSLDADADVRLLLVGGGPAESRPKALTAELDVDRQVVFTGRVPRQRVRQAVSSPPIAATRHRGDTNKASRIRIIVAEAQP